MALDMARFLARFVDEARDHVSKLNAGLVQLENRPEDIETINAVFRSAHTIKGSSRMMKLTPITEVAHKLEEALGALRDRKIGHSPLLADVLFKGIDCIAGMIEKVASGGPLDEDTNALCEELARAAEGRFAPAAEMSNPLPDAPGNAQAASTTVIASLEKDLLVEAHPPDNLREPAVQERKAGTSESIRVNAGKLDELIRLMGEIVSHQNRLKQRLADIREAEKGAKRNVDLSARLQEGNDSSVGLGEQVVRCAQALEVRLKQLSVSMRDDANMQELLTSELQEKALMLRMVPLATVFDSLPRMVRDMSRSLGKDIEFMVEGGDIGLDKKMIEKIGDPLVHMLRNAIDHGIESPEERRKAGKPEKGTIRIGASYDAGSVLIVLSDDGGGIPLDKLRDKARKKNMFPEADLQSLTEEEIIDLIFLPGFSTSAIITDISGRGVGMDVVKKNIVEGLKGSIKIESKPGKGTTFLMRLPMTLAVMRVLLVEVSGTVFAITAHYVTEIIRVPESEIIHVLDRKAIRLREELIPVAHLETVLRIPENGRARSPNLLMLIVRLGNEKLGLIVDTLLDEEDMVIKSLPAHMKDIDMVSGVTISGRNEVINILHVPGIMKEAGEMKETRLSERVRTEAAQILVVDDSVNTREIEKSILEAYGYAVDLAEDGIEAVEKTREKQYDLIITDVEMPRLDGFSLTERLRKEGSYSDTPIIIMTSREKEEDKKRGILVGANAYIIKGSFDQTNLLETVQNLIG